MNTQKILWLIFVAIFVLPLVGYFVVNGYWWLFDGNQPIADKMAASVCFASITTTVAWAWKEELK